MEEISPDDTTKELPVSEIIFYLEERLNNFPISHVYIGPLGKNQIRERTAKQYIFPAVNYEELNLRFSLMLENRGNKETPKKIGNTYHYSYDKIDMQYPIHFIIEYIRENFDDIIRKVFEQNGF